MDGEAGDRESDTNANGSPATVRLTVPEYQLDEWTAHADELEMSTNEFVRSMVQAGRRGFGETTIEAKPGTNTTAHTGDGTDAPVDGPTNGLRDELLDALSTREYRSWDDLREHVVDDVEATLDADLLWLLDEDRVEHSPRKDGYRLVE